MSISGHHSRIAELQALCRSLDSDDSSANERLPEAEAEHLFRSAVQGDGPLLIQVSQSDGDVWDRAFAVWALGWVGDCSALPHLFQVLQPANQGVMALAAIASIARLKSTAGLVPLYQYIVKALEWASEDPTYSVSEEVARRHLVARSHLDRAVEGMALICGREALHPLGELLK